MITRYDTEVKELAKNYSGVPRFLNRKTIGEAETDIRKIDHFRNACQID